MEMSGHCHGLSWFGHFSAWENTPGSYWLGGWEGLVTSLDAVKKRGITSSCQQSDSCPACCIVLYHLSYSESSVDFIWICFNTLTRNQLFVTGNVKVMFLQAYISLVTLFVWVVMFQLCWGLWLSLFLCQISVVGLVKKGMWAVRIALPDTTAVSPFHCRSPRHVAANILRSVRPKTLQTQHM